LGVSDIRLQELAHEYRLPFAFSAASRSFFIRAIDEPLW
jgi:hypothetical protein